jgi:hypothetical protein
MPPRVRRVAVGGVVCVGAILLLWMWPAGAALAVTNSCQDAAMDQPTSVNAVPVVHSTVVHAPN